MTELEASKIVGKERIRNEYMKACMIVSPVVNGTTYVIDNARETLVAFWIAERAAEYTGSPTCDFRDIDNTLHTLPLDDFKILIGEMCVGGEQYWHKKVDLQTQIDNATSVEEILSIGW